MTPFSDLKGDKMTPFSDLKGDKMTPKPFLVKGVNFLETDTTRASARDTSTAVALDQLPRAATLRRVVAGVARQRGATPQQRQSWLDTLRLAAVEEWPGAPDGPARAVLLLAPSSWEAQTSLQRYGADLAQAFASALGSAVYLAITASSAVT